MAEQRRFEVGQERVTFAAARAIASNHVVNAQARVALLGHLDALWVQQEQSEREVAELQEQLAEVNKQNSISCDALDLAATRHDDELRAVGTERDSLRAQLTEAQRENEALRAERDGLLKRCHEEAEWRLKTVAGHAKLTDELRAEIAALGKQLHDCGAWVRCDAGITTHGKHVDRIDSCIRRAGHDGEHLACGRPCAPLSGYCPECGGDSTKQSPTSDSPAKLGASEAATFIEHHRRINEDEASPAKLGGAVSREELVEALRLPGAHGPVEYALNRVATALERGGKTDG